ncbi:uncharacterized protein LOC116048565 isoform X2 [Sander lucioperca]|uniref:uncharacterized protein LOC116048565 isoform X2 n=1 Tax=Sander lucioperca TaxID=283035 RepID=UPI00125DB130|nr:uncharacterized protein LOC116048565 isoform X2 [Sander lucioperca]
MTCTRHHSADFKCLQTFTARSLLEPSHQRPWNVMRSHHHIGISAHLDQQWRNVEVKSEESCSERVELTVGVETSKPEMLFELSSGLYEDSEAFGCKNGLFESPSPLRLSPATAAAQTQMPSTKPKARTLVACRQLTDGNEAASLKDQSPLPLLTLTGTVSLASTDPRRPSSVHASITGKASVSAAQQQEAQRLNGRSASIIREENKSQYYRDLTRQVEEKKQQLERERSRNAVEEQKHIDTMQHTIWGMPGCGAPNYYLGSVKRTKSLCDAGILPQEQTRDKGFSGTPFHRP